MSNVSALSHIVAVPHGRDGPGIWEQNAEGFMDFMQALMSRDEFPAARIPSERPAPPDNGMWMARMGTQAPPIDKDVRSVVISSVAKGQEDLLLLVALLTGEEDNDDFLRALEQYIAQKPEILAVYNTLFTEKNTDKDVAWLERLVEALKPKQETDLAPELAPLLLFWPDLAQAWQVRTEETVTGGTPALTQWDLSGGRPAEITAVTAPVQEAPDAETYTPYIQEPAVPQEVAASGTAPAAPLEIPLPEGAAEQFTATAAVMTLPEQRPAAERTHPDITQGAPAAGEAPAAADKTPPRLSYANMVARTVNMTMRWTEPIREAPAPAGEEAEEEFLQAQDEPEAVLAPRTEQTGPSRAEPIGTRTETADNVSRIQTAQAAHSPPAVQAAQAEVKTEGVAPARQILADNIISQIVQNAAQNREATVLHMELHPKFLGKIQITLEAAGGSIIAKLKSDNGAVRSLLNENLAELKESLKQAGVNMKDVEVSETSIRANLSDRQDHRQQEQAAWNQRQDGPKPVKITPLSAAQAAEEPEPPGNSYAVGRVAGGDTNFDYRA